MELRWNRSGSSRIQDSKALKKNRLVVKTSLTTEEYELAELGDAFFADGTDGADTEGQEHQRACGDRICLGNRTNS